MIYQHIHKYYVAVATLWRYFVRIIKYNERHRLAAYQAIMERTYL